ncbi:hypothetical protein LTR70_007086 [Exophiala xenobiotica]|uniref:F-box domain-containing protein n=1 Tax=Lithohypha guttulata TaxID=1690604 RepID=A0ABR0K801_9EURO|nr:hypothetical protein LTR24_006279 [Lithohypha guttulata]KAK5314649.1 hypothetical protein LTR70_007086 [Exophiala xenobiotica]
MAASLQNFSPASNGNSIGLPNEIISRILLHASTPTFVQLVQTSKEFHNVAGQYRTVLLHHLHQIPGDKELLVKACISNEELLLLLRQRATNNLYGVNHTANMTEHRVKALLDPTASSIAGLTDDYVRMALVYKDSGDIRHLTPECTIKEMLIQQPGVRVLKTHQRNTTLSALCAWPKVVENGVPDSESEDEVCPEDPFPLTANARLTSVYHAQMDKAISTAHEKDKEISIGFGRPIGQSEGRYVYRVVHFNIYAMEDSRTFTIDSFNDFVPRDFVTSSSDQCAILWDRDMSGGRPTEDATIIYYSANQAEFHYATDYNARVVWPKTDLKGKLVKDNDPEYLPERIASFKDGRRIKIYGAGGVVPYKILSTASGQHDALYASTNVINYDGFSFHVDTPFFGTHTAHYDELYQQNWCFLTHLCLGITTLDLENEDERNKVKVLCILRSQIQQDPETCKHEVDCSRMCHVSERNATVVARLWGFEEMHTNLTGKETISISAEGTRIAIAMWDRVYVYPLNPRVLCEENPVDNSDDENSKAKKKKKRSRKPWDPAPSGYYKRKKDKNLLNWKVAELKPIVLDLNGAVAHKMNWSKARGIVTDTIPSVPQAVEASLKDVDAGDQNDIIDTSDQLSETTTESSLVTAIQDEGSTGDLPLSQSTGTETQDVSQLLNSTVQQPVEAEKLPSAAATQHGADAGPAINFHTLQVQESNTHSFAPLESTKVHKELKINSTAAVVHSSPSMSNTKDDGSLALLTNGVFSAVYSNSVSLLDTAAAPSALNANPVSATNPKSSARKKDKLVECNNLENVPLGPVKEPTIPCYTQPAQEHKTLAEPSAPPSPLLSKGTQKSKLNIAVVSQTVVFQSPQDTALVQQPDEPVPAKSEPNQADAPQEVPLAEPKPKTEPEPEPETDGPHVEGGASAKSKEAVYDDQTTAVNSSHSKTSSSNVPPPEPVIEADKAAQTKTRKTRIKRITEDELMILTDRGIQIWDLGARATGKRVKRMLPLDETLRGKLPRRKTKQSGVGVTNGRDRLAHEGNET